MAGKALGISLDDARQIIRAGQETAQQMGLRMNIAVVGA